MKFTESIRPQFLREREPHMSKLDLKNVTLVCADGNNKKEAKQLLEMISEEIHFHDTKVFTKNLNSIKDYNLFVASKLSSEIESEFCMVVQLDGYPLNLGAWDDAYLKYDYIGAPWYTQPHPIEKTVGNGGFSIRSKKYLEECEKMEFAGEIPEDEFFCRKMDDVLKDQGIKFAPHTLAYKFSVEDLPYKGQFGFHGRTTIQINQSLGIFS